MSTTIHTQGTHTITRADGGVEVVAFESTQTVDVLPPEIPVPVPEPEPPALAAGLTVTLDVGGVQHVFEEQGATDLGEYVGPHFTQQCFEAICPTLPAMSVFFRPDADGMRQEVVFELGRIWPTEPTANMGAYTATIYRLDHETGQGTTLATIAVPHHNWFGRWRWQSAPRPVTTSVAELIAAGLLPHYDAHVGGGHTPASQAHSYAGPMDLAGITAYMPQTGGRDDIGLITECQADYLCTGSDAALSSLLAQLEGSGTLPWHYRDENTGAPLDTYAYPNASSYRPESDPYIPLQVGDGGGITLDTSHEPDLAYVPFLLTGDPYALEELQFAVTYNVIKQPPEARKDYNMGGALRAHAWALRAMARAARVTPDVVPQWLLDRQYFRQMLDGNRAWIMGEYVNNATPMFQELSMMGNPGWGAPAEATIPADCSAAFWWEDYEQAVQGHIVEMGFTDWVAVYEWKIRNAIDRCNGTSGWNRSQECPYKTAMRETAASPYVTSWQECWDINLRMGVVVEADPAHLVDGDLSYPQQTLAALQIAARLGIEGANVARDWLEAEIQRLSTAQSFVYARWSIA